MSDNILVSQENVLTILPQFINDLKTKINNKDISLPYTTEFTKGSVLKIDGLGDMFLSNNGTYVKIGTITQDQLDISKINQIFSIKSTIDHWDNSGIKTMSYQRSDFGCILYNGKIYCIGGTSSILAFSIYDITNNTWSTSASLPVNRTSFGCIMYNSKIYIIGGFTTTGENTVIIYDITTNSWSDGTNIPTVRQCCSYELYNGKIYLIGGYSGTGSSTVISNLTSIYDIASNTWSTGAYMPAGKTDIGSSLINGKIYCIGGSNNVSQNSNYIYDIASNTWSTGAGMTVARYGLRCIPYNNKIYAIGGCNSTTLNNVEIYDTLNNTWKTGVSMPVSTAYFGCIIFNGKIYVIGGNNHGYNVDVLYVNNVSYSITLPSSLSTKLNKLISTGTGTKIFSNDGTYKSITPSYTVMDSATINSFLSTI